jgi:hypothetical protein
LFVTVNTVPNGSVGLAQYPSGASEYHVACPASEFVGRGCVVVVVGGGGGGGGGRDVVVVVGGGGGALVGVVGAVVVVVGATVVVVVVDAVACWYATRCDFRSTPSWCVAGNTLCIERTTGAAVRTRDAWAVSLCSKRRGSPNNTPHRTAATPRRLPPVLWFLRAPPF